MKRDYHHGDLRNALIQAARELIDGGQAPSLRAVARAAGVSQAAPYRHFTDKEALLAAVAEQGFAALADAMRAHADVEHPEERVQKMGVQYVKFGVENPAWFRLMFGGAVDQSKYPSCQAAAQAAFGLLAGGVVEAVKTRRLVGEVHDLTLVAWSLVHGMAALMIDGQGLGAGLDPSRVDAVAERVTLAAIQSMRP